MTRYYYDCPLKAAWMLKQFGMKVTRTHCHRGDGKFGESMQPIPIWILARDVENQVSEHVRYYVTQESLRLLEPQSGDFLWVKADEDGVIRAKIPAGANFMLIDHSYQSNTVIDKRNGIAFHWPESEAA